LSQRRVVLCGYGRFGRVYVQRVAAHPDFEVCGVVEQPSMLAEVRADGFDAYADLEDALVACDASLVVVATSEDAHTRIGRLALSHPCDVMLAKPGALSLADARSVADTAHHYQRNVFVDWTPLWMRGYAELKAQAQLLGEWVTIRFSRRDWSASRACGVVWDLMPHDVAMATDLVPFSRVVDVDASRWRDGAHLVLTFANDLVIRIEADYASSTRDRSVEIITQDGYASWLADEELVFTSASTEPIDTPDKPDAITKHLDRIAGARHGEDDLDRFLQVVGILEAAQASLDLRSVRRDALDGLAVAA
jgi:predicted dehydrogenase